MGMQLRTAEGGSLFSSTTLQVGCSGSTMKSDKSLKQNNKLDLNQL